MALDINNAGAEFVKSILTLYRSAKYFREKEILAKKLLDSAVETGHLINQVGTCTEEKRGAVAGYARIQLSKTMFIVKIMGETGVYPNRRIRPVDAMAQQITDLLGMYEKAEPAVPDVAVPVDIVPSVGEDERPLLRYIDNDGFNEVYDGKIIKY